MTNKGIYFLGAFLMLVRVVNAQTADSIAVAEPVVETAAVSMADSVTGGSDKSELDMVAADIAATDSTALGESGYIKHRPERVKRALRFDRGLAFDTKTPSMPKGLFITGMNIGYSQHTNDQFSMLILGGLNSRGNSFNVSPMLHYVFANNQSIGVRFSYKRTNLEFDIDREDLSIAKEMLDMILAGDLRYKYTSHNYMGYVSYRYYVGFGQNMRRLLFFNEVQLGFGGGQHREEAGTRVDENGNPKLDDSGQALYRRQTHQKSFNFRVGFSPGVTFFMTNSLAMEMQIGLLGYEFTRIKQVSTRSDILTHTPEDGGGKYEFITKKEGGRKSSSISSKFDFLSIAFGMSFHI